MISQKLQENEPLIQQLRLADLGDYLRVQRWVKAAADAVETEYHGPNDDEGTPIAIVLPSSEKSEGWRRRAIVAINALSVVLGQSPQDVIREVCSMSRDIIRVAIAGSKTSNGTAGLGDAIRLLVSHWTLISFSACSEEDPQPYFEKARAIGKQQADRCHMGQTFRGSFGITIESPLLPPRGAQMPMAGIAPLERRTITRIARGLADLNFSMTHGDVSPLATGHKHGLNGNMCDELLTLGTRLEGQSLHYSFVWSPRLAASGDVLRSSTIQLTEQALTYLESASKLLRTGTDIGIVTVTGKVTKLQSDLPPTMSTGTEDRSVTILGTHGSGPRLRIRVQLMAGDYRRACDAHRDGREVSVKGTLEKEGKFWKLRQPSDFTVIEETRLTK